MLLDVDTFLAALYTIVDDLYHEHFAGAKPLRPGPDPKLTDSEVLTLLLCAQWFGPSERAFVRYARRHWRTYFPRLLGQSSTNRRSRDLVGVLVCLAPLVATQLETAWADYQILDGVPVRLMRPCRGRQHRLFADEAAIGKGGSDKQWYYGCQLLLSVTPAGVITGFLLAPADTQTRWATEAFLCWRVDAQGTPRRPADLERGRNHRGGKDYVGPTGPIWPRAGVGEWSPVPYIADDDFGGQQWTPYWATAYQAEVFTTTCYGGEQAKDAQEQHRRWRHVIETVNAALSGALHLSYLGARTRWGLLTRVAAKLVAFNLSILLNRLFGREDFAVATLFSY